MKRALLALMISLIPLTLSAGDAAAFLNLGFSPDGRYFLFGVHGVEEETSHPYAELYLVDVPRNEFVPAGIQQKTFAVSLLPGQESIGALLALLYDAIPLVEKHRIDHLRQGRLLYILLDGERPKEYLEFRDFYTSTLYRVTLIQTEKGSKETSEAAFHLQVVITGREGTHRTYLVGRPNYYRKGVQEYRIRQVILAPDDASLVFVMEKRIYAPTGPSIRYMVETITP